MRAAGQQKASTLKDLSWQKANEMLATQYGGMAVSGVDNSSALAERLLEYYFPRRENDAVDDNTPIDANADPSAISKASPTTIFNHIFCPICCVINLILLSVITQHIVYRLILIGIGLQVWDCFRDCNYAALFLELGLHLFEF